MSHDHKELLCIFQVGVEAQLQFSRENPGDPRNYVNSNFNSIPQNRLIGSRNNGLFPPPPAEFEYCHPAQRSYQGEAISVGPSWHLRSDIFAQPSMDHIMI